MNRASAGGLGDRRDRDLELAEHGVGRLQALAGLGGRVRPGATTIWFSPSSPTTISATPVGSSTRRTPSRSTPPSSSSASASSANGSSPTAPTIDTLAPRLAAASAWFAPFPPGTRSKVAPVSVSPGRGSRSQRATRSRLIDPTTAIEGAFTARSWHGRGQVTQCYEQPRGRNGAALRSSNTVLQAFSAGSGRRLLTRLQAARARRSSSVRPSRFSRRSKRPAQSDERSGSEPSSAAARRPSRARTSTASSR